MSGTLRLTRTSPPQTFAEPLTEAEVSGYLRLPEVGDGAIADPAAAADIRRFIRAAREQAELFQGRDLVSKQWDLTLDDLNAPTIQLREPLVSVDLFTYRDSDGATTTLAEGTGYIIDTAKGLVMPPYNESWPSFTAWPTSSVLIRHTVGPAEEIPAQCQVGMLVLISDWFNDRLIFGTGKAVAASYPQRLRLLLGSGGRGMVA